jgi:hypothetical protein
MALSSLGVGHGWVYAPAIFYTYTNQNSSSWLGIDDGGPTNANASHHRSSTNDGCTDSGSNH